MGEYPYRDSCHTSDEGCIFTDKGVPVKLIDGGPQFSSWVFKQFCCGWGLPTCRAALIPRRATELLKQR